MSSDQIQIIKDNNYYDHELRQRSPDITLQRQNSPEFEREIYEKWLKKCKEDANYSRQASEQNNFDRIKFEREVLNRVGNIPDPEKTKLYTPYMQPNSDGKNNYYNSPQKKENLKMNMIYIHLTDSQDTIMLNFMKMDMELKGEEVI